MVKALISQPDGERIAAAVAAVEARTSAELAVVVTPSADSYALYPLIWAFIVALLAAGLMAFLAPQWESRLVFAIQAAVFIIVAVLLEIPGLRRHLVPGRVKRSHAAHLARLQFDSRVRDRTAERTGVLLFATLAERHVEIIADEGIHARAGGGSWQAAIAAFRAAVARGNLVDGLIVAIGACGDLLATHAPRAVSAPNQLPDRPVEISPP
jgi:putative membrane protein